jgi:hypothetical protein
LKSSKEYELVIHDNFIRTKVSESNLQNTNKKYEEMKQLTIKLKKKARNKMFTKVQNISKQKEKQEKRTLNLL